MLVVGNFLPAMGESLTKQCSLEVESLWLIIWRDREKKGFFSILWFRIIEKKRDNTYGTRHRLWSSGFLELRLWGPFNFQLFNALVSTYVISHPKPRLYNQPTTSGIEFKLKV